MLEKTIGKKIEIKPRIPKENEKLCDTCGGTGWLYNNEGGYITYCSDCYSGIITLCEICHEPKKGMCMNRGCQKVRWDAEEQKHLNKAIKAQYKDVPDDSKGMMYSDVYAYNEGYFDDIDSLREYCYDEGILMPEHVWSTRQYALSMDAGSIIENACSELHEDAMYNIEGEEELQAFLDEWCRKQTGTTTYCVDYKYAILISNC